MRHIIFWALPIIGLVIVLRAQLVRALYGSGAFDWSDTRLTAAVLAIFIISLVGQSLILLLVRAFYAAQHKYVPLLVAILGMLVTVTVAVVVMFWYESSPGVRLMLEQWLRLEGVAGSEVLVLALAYTVGILIETVVLVWWFARSFACSVRGLMRQVCEATVAMAVGSVVAYGALRFLVDGVNQETLVGILLQGGVAGVLGVIAVGCTYRALGSEELFELYRSCRARLARSAVIAPQQETL